MTSAPATPRDPPSSGSTTPIPCSGSQPSLGVWTCSGGQWASGGSVTGGSAVIPGSQVVIKGNLTISGDLTFSGLESSIVVEGGCAEIEGSLEIELTMEDLEKISKEPGATRTISLISQNSSCSTLSSIPVNACKIGSSCRKIETAKTTDATEGTKTTLSVVFEVNSAKCHTKWIILGSVLGGVLLLIIIIILIVTFNNKAKTAVRPFWARVRMTKPV